MPEKIRSVTHRVRIFPFAEAVTGPNEGQQRHGRVPDVRRVARLLTLDSPAAVQVLTPAAVQAPAAVLVLRLDQIIEPFEDILRQRFRVGPIVSGRLAAKGCGSMKRERGRDEGGSA